MMNSSSMITTKSSKFIFFFLSPLPPPLPNQSLSELDSFTHVFLKSFCVSFLLFGNNQDGAEPAVTLTTNGTKLKVIFTLSFLTFHPMIFAPSLNLTLLIFTCFYYRKDSITIMSMKLSLSRT